MDFTVGIYGRLEGHHYMQAQGSASRSFRFPPSNTELPGLRALRAAWTSSDTLKNLVRGDKATVNALLGMPCCRPDAPVRDSLVRFHINTIANRVLAVGII